IGLDEVKSKVKIGHDILLLKTCFGRFRGKRVYSFNNPVVDAKIGLWLRSERPNIRVIGLDLISLGSHNKRELARQAHRAFLNPRGKGSPILIIEDMDLSCNLSGLIRVIVAPLLIMNIDSAPCTVYGIFNK
ncbi:MAG: cyclase, partial [Candidatus Orphnella occulta]|nr:cyclase [Candidatus Orphnella occulta]